MAVTLSPADLLAALRLGDSPEETAEVTRLLAYATEAVTQHAPNAPDVVHEEAAIRLGAYIFDQPTAGRSDGYANALRSSGAARMLLAYRTHRLGLSDAVAEAQAALGSTGNPVVGLDVIGGELVVTFADGTLESLTLPAGMGGTTDQVARDAAGAAQAAADANAVTAAAHAAEANAHHTPPTGGGSPTYTILGVGFLNGIRAGFSFTSLEALAIRAAWDTSDYLEFRFTLSPGRFVSRQVRTIPQPLPSTAIQVYVGLATGIAGAAMIVEMTLAADSASVSTGIDNTWLTGAALQVYGVS